MKAPERLKPKVHERRAVLLRGGLRACLTCVFVFAHRSSAYRVVVSVFVATRVVAKRSSIYTPKTHFPSVVSVWTRLLRPTCTPQDCSCLLPRPGSREPRPAPGPARGVHVRLPGPDPVRRARGGTITRPVIVSSLSFCLTLRLSPLVGLYCATMSIYFIYEVNFVAAVSGALCLSSLLGLLPRLLPALSGVLGADKHLLHGFTEICALWRTRLP